MFSYEHTPHVELVDGGVHIERSGVVAHVDHEAPFGPDIKIMMPLTTPATIERLSGCTCLSQVVELEDACALWSVLTCAIGALEPAYCATRLRQIEGDQVAREEAS